MRKLFVEISPADFFEDAIGGTAGVVVSEHAEIRNDGFNIFGAGDNGVGGVGEVISHALAGEDGAVADDHAEEWDALPRGDDAGFLVI